MRRFSRTAVSTSSRPSAMKVAPISSAIDGLPKNRRERSCGWRRSPWPEVWLTKAPDGQMRGPGILPASMAALSSKIGPPASRTLVKPRSRVRADSVATVAASFSGLASGASRSAWDSAVKVLCQCTSIRPGISVRPWPSITRAEAVGRAPSPIAAMRLPRTSTSVGAPSVPRAVSSTRTSRNSSSASASPAGACACANAGSRSSRAIAHRRIRFIFDIMLISITRLPGWICRKHVGHVGPKACRPRGADLRYAARLT